MKRWIPLIVVVAALVVLALSAGWWLPPFLAFVGANSDIIQGLTDLVQLWWLLACLWPLGTLISETLIRWERRSAPEGLPGTGTKAGYLGQEQSDNLALK